MMKGRLLALALGALWMVGCGNPSVTKAPEPVPDTKAPVETTKPEPEMPVAEALPASLKHDGYEWYGLGSTKPIKMSLDRQGTKMTGEASFELVKVEAGEAVYKQVWTGDLPVGGDVEVKVTEKGVYGITAQGQKLDPPQMELPAKPTPGFSWKSPGKIDVANGTLENTVRKIVGIKSIKVAGRTVNALVAQSVSKLTVAGKTQTMETKEFYEKGVGAVRLEVKLSGGGQSPSSFVMEAVP